MKKILVIEDDYALGWLLRSILSPKYEVVIMKNGMEAMEWLTDGNYPNLIISDLNMPFLDGVELLQNIRASGFLRGIPVIILSCDLDPEKNRQCMALGAFKYVMKPFNPDTLMLEIGKVLGIHNIPKTTSIALEKI